MAKYIKFEAQNRVHDGMPVFSIINKHHGDVIGEIFWYKDWKQMVARFKEDSIWSEDCLEDVRLFILGLNNTTGG